MRRKLWADILFSCVWGLFIGVHFHDTANALVAISGSVLFVYISDKILERFL